MDDLAAGILEGEEPVEPRTEVRAVQRLQRRGIEPVRRGIDLWIGPRGSMSRLSASLDVGTALHVGRAREPRVLDGFVDLRRGAGHRDPGAPERPGVLRPRPEAQSALV